MAFAKLPNGITLAWESHGDPSAPAILVILGITDNITDWPPGLVQPLVEAGFRVIRYELRDMGLSTHFEDAGVPDLAAAAKTLAAGSLPDAPYTARDMAQDAVLLLDALDISRAAVVGYSYGSLVAQRLALDAPDRVTALVCLQGSNYNPALPARSPEVEAAMFGAVVDYPTEAEKVAAITRLRKATSGAIHTMDDEEALASATVSVARAYYPAGTSRIILSRMATPPLFRETANIACPTLVLHGDQDPIFSPEHGQDMRDRIPGARLVMLEGAGHNHPLSLQPVIAGHIAGFLQQAL